MHLQKTKYEVIPPAIYRATIAEIKADDGEYGPQLHWRFTLMGWDKSLQAWSSQRLSKKSKAGGWVLALLGKIPDDLDTDVLVGRRCRLQVGVKAGDDGEYNNIEAILGPGGPAAVADNSGDPEIPDDLPEDPGYDEVEF